MKHLHAEKPRAEAAWPLLQVWLADRLADLLYEAAIQIHKSGEPLSDKQRDALQASCRVVLRYV